MSSTKVVFTVCIVYQTIYRINYLFQNGRALLKCRIFIPPTYLQFSGFLSNVTKFIRYPGGAPVCSKIKNCYLLQNIKVSMYICTGQRFKPMVSEEYFTV
jgi:hypothetical protein